MSAQDFSEEQRRYLEGFVSGVQARRAAQGLKPLGADGARPDAARAANERRSATPSLRSSEDTWLSTVRTEMKSRSAISAFVRCSATSASTSASRAETPASWGTPSVWHYMFFFGFSVLDCLAMIMSLILS